MAVSNKVGSSIYLFNVVFKFRWAVLLQFLRFVDIISEIVFKIH